MKKSLIGTALAVVFFHTAAFAQQAPPPAAPPAPEAPAPAPAPPPPPPPMAAPPAPPPPPPGPPPGPPTYPYGPPPGYRPPPSYYYYPPPAAHRGVYRPFNMSVGLGLGMLSEPGVGSLKRSNELGYNFVARLGFGITADFVVFLGIDGTGISTSSADVTQTNYLIGVQYFIVPRLYVRGGLGIASVTGEDAGGPFSAAGQAFLGGVGVELLQGDSVSFGLEWNSSVARFRLGPYFTNGASFVLSFF